MFTIRNENEERTRFIRMEVGHKGSFSKKSFGKEGRGDRNTREENKKDG